MHPRAGAALSRAVLEQHRRQVFGHVLPRALRA
jgi:hypothetical protein